MLFRRTLCQKASVWVEQRKDKTMFFIEEKLTARIAELQTYRYKERAAILGWKVKEDKTKAEKYPPNSMDGWMPFSLGDAWEGRDYYLWIQTTYEVPDTNQQQVLLFDFGHTGGGFNSGFESLLFIDGVPYQGVDSNHKEVFLDEKYRGKQIQLCLKLWSGLEGGGPEKIQHHRFEQADAVLLDEATDDLYYTSDCILKTITQLDGQEAVRYELLDILDKAYRLIDWSYPGNSEFYQSVKQANELLQTYLDTQEKRALVTITAIGHTHIDVAWLWRLKHTREKAARSFSTVLQLMKQYPDYVFLQTQPQLYKYIKKDYPELYNQIKERIKEGRWEVDGAMWLEADCNIPSGESLTRQILYGTKFIKEEFNQAVHYLWLPDVFGYSWALPQILKKSGIETFMTTKISWNQFNRMPHDTFKWRGMDGTDILTHFITTPEPGNTPENTWATNWFYTYNGQLEPETVKGIYNAYRDKDFNKELLLSYGYGDGGGGVTRSMLENRRRMDKIPGLPNVQTGKAVDYFDRLHQTVEETDHYVHTWDGELYLEYHRGTYTSQAFVKKNNRKLELALRELEILYASQQGSAQRYPKERFDELWELLLRNQFHDIIPGSSIKEVYQDYREEMAEAWEKVRLLYNLLESPSLTEWTIVNTSGWKRKELVEIITKETGRFFTEGGEELVSEKTEKGYLVLVPELAALGSLKISLQQEEPKKSIQKLSVIQEFDIETAIYRICWNEKGQLTSIFDKENQREVVKEKGIGNKLQVFEDKPMNYNAWDIDIYYQEKGQTLSATSIQVVENTALQTILSFDYVVGKSSLTQQMILYKDSRRIDFHTVVDWREREKLLKAGFEVDIRSTEATYDIQYGNVKRPTHWNTSWDMAKFETVAHQWVDLSERDYGISLLNDCKYGHDIKEQTLRITLLKGAVYPDPTADIGHHEFTYSLLPHKGDFVEGKTHQEAWSLNQPLTVLAGNLDAYQTLFELDTELPVCIDAIKQAENGEGIIIRIHDHLGSRRKIRINPLFSHEEWMETNLMEKPIEEGKSKDLPIEFTLLPFEIKTIRVK